MVATTISENPLIPKSRSSKSRKPKFTLDNVRKCQNEGLTVSKASKKFGVPKPTFMKNLREGLKIFGWNRNGYKELRLDYEKIQLEVLLIKVDSNNAQIGRTCAVVSIEDSDLFEEAKNKMCRRLGKGVYTFKFKCGNDEWVILNDSMDYEVCISHFKYIKRAEEATKTGQRIAAKIKPYTRVRMTIYAQLMPPRNSIKKEV